MEIDGEMVLASVAFAEEMKKSEAASRTVKVNINVLPSLTIREPTFGSSLWTEDSGREQKLLKAKRRENLLNMR